MSFEIRNSADDTVLHANNETGEDFNTGQLVENTVKLNLPFADASMHQWRFDGIRIGYHNWEYKKHLEMAWKGNLDVVTLYFNMKGKTTICNSHFEKPFVLGKYQHNLFYSQTGEGALQNNELSVNTFMIQCTRDAFLRIAEGANDTLKRFGDKVAGGKTAALSTDSLFMDIDMQQAINAVISCRYQPGLKKILLLSKTMELLVMQAEAYHRALSATDQYLKNAYDRERIHYAREYLVRHIDMPPSLSQLARITGINEYKLKKGFKEVFGNTVFGYLSETRLELAKNELLEKTKTASQLAFELGYSSVQHFSSAFKKKFGVSPAKLGRCR